MKVCRDFEKDGKCKFGKKCKFSHISSATLTRPSRTGSSLSNTSRDSFQKICSYFQRTGRCNFGDDCKYSHEISTTGSSSGSDKVLSEQELVALYIEFLKRSLSSPALSGKSSQDMVWTHPQLLNGNPNLSIDSFFRSNSAGKSLPILKKFVSTLLNCLTGHDSFASERAFATLARRFTEFRSYVKEILCCCDQKTDLTSAFSTLLIPLVFVFTNSIVISGPLVRESNIIYSVVNEQFDHFVDIFTMQFDFYLRDYSAFRIESNEKYPFKPVAITHYLLPFLELVIHVVNLFQAPKYSTSLRQFVLKMEGWITLWEEELLKKPSELDGSVIGLNLESRFNIQIVRKSLEKLSRVSEIALSQINPNPNPNPVLSIQPQKWIWNPLEGPGNRHSNDHLSIKDISVGFVVDEILSKKQPALPGNHQMTLDAHWLPFGPERLIDTHFRLFREDMLRSCRSSIQALLSNLNSKDTQRITAPYRFDYNLYVYPSVEIRSCDFDERMGICFQLDYKKSRGSRKAEFSYGHLVAVVSLDPFEIAFAKVSDVKDGQKIITLTTSEDVDEERLLRITKNSRLFKEPIYLIYLSNILLDSIVPVLKAIQLKDPALLPFTKYICPPESLVDGIGEIDPPAYSLARDFSFDLSFLVGRPLRLDVSSPVSKAECLSILEEHSTLDNGQSKAFISALSSEYSCIQGPPGTGKSYLGVRIVQCLLKTLGNSAGPILIISHTNHALDQFLEHLLDAKVEGIVRLGSRKASERLQDYLLDYRHLGNEFGSKLKKLKDEINEMVAKFEKIGNKTFSKTAALNNWYASRKIMEEFFPDLMNSLQVMYEDEISDGFEMTGKKGKGKINNPLILWMSLHSKSKSNRDIEDLMFTTDDPWNEISEMEKETIVSFINRNLNDEHLEELQALSRRFRSVKTSMDAIYEVRKLDYLKKRRVIGLTTTGAAMNQGLLKNIDAKIVICEEAGEILEVHTLAFLNAGLSHLIMIGDHLQLRPHVAEYALSVESAEGKKYSFDLSQFERMQLPEYQYPLVTLGYQRRMRPEISTLIRKTLYPDLLDHESVVHERVDVLGLRKNVYFLDHNNAEDNLKKERHEGSHSNTWEAMFSVTLVKYFINQGYAPSEVTILTPYLGQLISIKEALSTVDINVLIDEKDAVLLERQDLLDDNLAITVNQEPGDDGYLIAKKNLKDCIRISTVDNYQGEENRIIIASLVRNCGEGELSKGKIGFLNIENRVNVLLSRAKEGLYLLGHARLLHLKSKMWSNVLDTLEEIGSIGDGFPLCCQMHPDYVQTVKSPEEIQILFPDGGCIVPCQFRLQCSHKCPRLCHSDDPRHIAVFCPNDCLRLRDTCTHPCVKRCGDPCEKCQVILPDYIFPSCGHVFAKPKCFQLPLLSEGEIKCNHQVLKTLPCNHENRISCSKDPDEVVCKSKCDEKLLCGHDCSSQCHKINDAAKHGTCKVKCNRKLACNHSCESFCHEGDCPPCTAQCDMMKCEHSKCNHPCSKNCKPCVEPCTWVCEHVDACPLPCGAPCIRTPCDLRCSKKLQCGHQCPSVCGEACPNQEYCQKCAKDPTIMNSVVDLILFQEYHQIDLDQSPIVVLECGHFKTIETLDGQLSLSQFYCQDQSGKWINGQFPAAITDLIPVPVCPDCRAPITQVKRYSRIIRSAQLDQSEKRFWLEYHKSSNSISREIQVFNDQTSEEQYKKALRLCKIGMKSPSELLWNSCLVWLGRKNLESLIANIFVPKPQNVIKANRHLLIAHLDGLLYEKRRNGRNFVLLSGSLSRSLNSVKLGMKCATEGYNEKLENDLALEEIKILLRRLQILSEVENTESSRRYYKLLDTSGDLMRFLKNDATEIKSVILGLQSRCVLSFRRSENFNVLNELSETLDFFIKTGQFKMEFNQKVANEVYQALLNANEFTGTGHWYRCPNGHLYVIGECGQAMQESKCPDCGVTIGGANHRLNATNQHAAEFEQVVTGVGNLDLL